MGAIDAAAVVQLGIQDAAAGLLLSMEANWNQTEEDWRFFLGEGTVFGIRDGSQLIATAALLPYAGGNAWISMVLVTAGWRRLGLATRLVDACLEKARTVGLTCWLDATPDGAAVYGPLGFSPTLQLRRLRLETAEHSLAPSTSFSTIDALRARDRRAMGFDRGALLTEFAQRARSHVISSAQSIALVRDGRTARHIGPLFAPDVDHALSLTHAIARGESRPLLIDAIASHEKFLEGLIEAGWKVERPFQRMRLGRDTGTGDELPF